MLAEDIDGKFLLLNGDVLIVCLKTTWRVKSLGILDVDKNVIKTLSPLESWSDYLNLLLALLQGIKDRLLLILDVLNSVPDG